MRKLLLFLLAILLSSCSTESLPQGQHTVSQDGLYTWEAKHGFEIFYDSGATKSVKEYYQSGSVVLNGSYFGKTESGMYYPAGLWNHPEHRCCTLNLGDPLNMNGPIISTSANTHDPNLSHIVGVSSSGGVYIFPTEQFERYAGPYTYAFQAGPLVLSGNILQSFSGSWHANEKYERTLIGKTVSGKVFFFASTIPRTLPEVGTLIVSRFQHDPITLLNLDGGPSTAFYDHTRGFRQDAKLPIIFRIRP